jgi:futalosine hydrolase
MEGAAVALAARRAGVRYGEVRVISNTTGDRDRQRWAIGAALAVLSDLFA